MKNERGFTKKVEIEIERPNGSMEIVDVTNTPSGNLIAIEHAASANLAKVRKATSDAGRGNVISATVTYDCDNLDELAHNYNNLHNEGAEGHIPYETLKASASYKEWAETVKVV